MKLNLFDSILICVFRLASDVIEILDGFPLRLGDEIVLQSE